MDYVNLIALSLFGSVLALIGGLAFLYIRSWSAWLTRNSMPFAAGVLLTVSLVGLLSEATHLIEEQAFLYTLGSFLAAFLFEHYLFGLHHHEEAHDHAHSHSQKPSSVALVLLGDTIHNFIDGVAIAASYLVSPSLGVITAISTFLHEVPHEIGDFGILLKAGWSKRWVLMVNLLSSLITVLGALLVKWFSPSDQFVGALLAVASGIFLYLGASDFLPAALSEKKTKNQTVAVFMMGVTIMLITLFSVPHLHE